jgi:hypothetical protein
VSPDLAHGRQYVAQRRLSGVSDEQIRAELAGAGWQPAEVAALLVPPPPPGRTGGNPTVILVAVGLGVLLVAVVVAAAALAWFSLGSEVSSTVAPTSGIGYGYP